MVSGCNRSRPSRSESADEASADQPATQNADKDPGSSIGSATMEADGTLVLMLRAEGPDGTVGDAMFRYPKTHPDYQKTLDHLGSLKPGETKPVPSWPDSE